MDREKHEGVYVESLPLGYHAIIRQSQNIGINANSQIEVIKIPTLEVQEECLVCQYEILDADYTDPMAKSLIIHTLLGDFYDHEYREEARIIQFLNLHSNTNYEVNYTEIA